MSGAGARGMCSRAMSVRGADRRMGRVRLSNGQQGSSSANGRVGAKQLHLSRTMAESQDGSSGARLRLQWSWAEVHWSRAQVHWSPREVQWSRPEVQWTS